MLMKQPAAKNAPSRLRPSFFPLLFVSAMLCALLPCCSHTLTTGATSVCNCRCSPPLGVLPWGPVIRNSDTVVFVVALDLDFPERYTPLLFQYVCGQLTRSLMWLSSSQKFAVVFASNENGKTAILPGWDTSEPTDPGSIAAEPRAVSGINAQFWTIDAINEMKAPKSPLQIEDSLTKAIRILQTGNGRESLIVITDSDITDNGDVLREFSSSRQANLSISALYLNMFGYRTERGAAFLRRIAASTNGTVWEIAWP